MTDASANFTDAIRKTCDAYAEALSTISRSLEGLPRQGGEAQRQFAEQWFSVARLGKDQMLSALNQGYEWWEREARRLVGLAHGAAAASAPTTPLDAWMEGWRRSIESFTAAVPQSDAWSEQMRRQAELVQQSLQEGLRAWQRLFRVG